MKTIYFVRHGQCQANAEGRLAGSRDNSPLTPLGFKQADDTARELAGKRIDLIVASPLLRTRETADRIADKLGYKGEIRIEPLLIERDFGEATGQALSAGFEALDAGTVPDVETLEALAERMQHLWDWFGTLSASHILVVGHSGCERMLRAIYEGKTVTGFFDIDPLRHAQIREYVLH